MKMPLISFALLLAGTVTLAQQPAKSSKATKRPAGTMSSMDAKRSNQSDANAYNGLPAGTGTTLEQTQAAKTPSSPTSTDARSSTMTGPSTVKARKNPIKSGKTSN